MKRPTVSVDSSTVRMIIPAQSAPFGIGSTVESKEETGARAEVHAC